MVPAVQTYKLGESLNVTCMATAFPPARITWKRKNQPIGRLGRVSAERGLLVITDLRRDDSGDYECIATNTAGEGSKIASINFIGNILSLFLGCQILVITEIFRLSDFSYYRNF